MDTSETYIKMCERVIPDLLFPEMTPPYTVIRLEQWEGSHLYEAIRVDKKDHIWFESGDYRNKQYFPKKQIPLYRQDQLQAMILIANYPTQVLHFLQNWITKEKILISNFHSMEQLWLAFLLAEKYNKYWDGKDWVLRQ